MKELVVLSNPKSALSEAIKTLRTNIQFSEVDKEIKTILITSSISGEGKSFISANLSATFASVGKKVLLVDCDLRRGRQDLIFGVKKDIGLSNLIVNRDQAIESFRLGMNYERYFIHKTKVNNLYLLTSGLVPPNPSEMLSTQRFSDLLNIFKKEFDLIILDGVPINGLSDSLILADKVDKIVIVCALKQTPSDLLIKTKKSLESYNDKIVGVVVNKVPSLKSKYYNNYYIND